MYIGQDMSAYLPIPPLPPSPARPFPSKILGLQAGKELYNIHECPLVWMTGRSGL